MFCEAATLAPTNILNRPTYSSVLFESRQSTLDCNKTMRSCLDATPVAEKFLSNILSSLYFLSVNPLEYPLSSSQNQDDH